MSSSDSVHVVEVQARIQAKPKEDAPPAVGDATPTRISLARAQTTSVRMDAMSNNLEVLRQELESEEIEAGSVTFFGIAVLQAVLCRSWWLRATPTLPWNAPGTRHT
jgi:hypothetical protein